MEKRKEITKPHSVITARMSLTAKEQDLLTLLIMKVKDSADKELFKKGSFNPMIADDIQTIPTIFEFDIKELAEILGTSVNTLKKQNRNPKTGSLEPCPLEKACQAIRNQDIKVRDERGFTGRRLVSDATFEVKTGILKLETTRTMAAIMLDYGLKNDNFGKTDMKLLFSLKGAYEKRILELISRFKNNQDFKLTLGEFCEILNVKYENYSIKANFRKVVIERPLAKIIKASNGMWEAKKGYPKGFHIARGAKLNDFITFKMKYNDPKLLMQPNRPKAVVDIETLMLTQAPEVAKALIPGYMKLLEEYDILISEEVADHLAKI